MKSPQSSSVTAGIRSRQHYPRIEALPDAQRYLVACQSPESLPGTGQAAGNARQQLQMHCQLISTLLDQLGSHELAAPASAASVSATPEPTSLSSAGLSAGAASVDNARLHRWYDVDDRPKACDALVGAISEIGVAGCLVIIGSEHFVWQVANLAQQQGLLLDDMVMLPVAALGRHVFCVHCQQVSEHVIHSPAACDGCGLMLEVRDHFSKRLGAYMGVRIDAEAPGEIPPQEEVAPCLAS
ncbi:hypothetical protein C8233_03670 [Halomonas sp. SF2003]|nr:hypothetical protein C8233_03670 [Halomonas sp. SF2003]